MPDEMYVILRDPGGDAFAITCRRCGRTSYCRRDIEELYCGCCHRWHDLEAIRAEADAITQRDEERRKRLGLDDTP